MPLEWNEVNVDGRVLYEAREDNGSDTGARPGTGTGLGTGLWMISLPRGLRDEARVELRYARCQEGMPYAIQAEIGIFRCAAEAMIAVEAMLTAPAPDGQADASASAVAAAGFAAYGPTLVKKPVPWDGRVKGAGYYLMREPTAPYGGTSLKYEGPSQKRSYWIAGLMTGEHASDPVLPARYIPFPGNQRDREIHAMLELLRLCQARGPEHQHDLLTMDDAITYIAKTKP